MLYLVFNTKSLISILSSFATKEIEFPVQEKDFHKIEGKNNICISVFGIFENSMDLLLFIDDDQSH